MKYLGANKQGSNQYRKRIKIDFLGKSTRTFVYYILLVIFFMAFFQLHKTGQVNWPWLEKMVKLQAHAQVRDWKMPELASMPERDRMIILIKRYFGQDANTAITVFTCESGLRANAENDNNSDGFPDVGVAQIHVTNDDPFSVAEMKNPEANLAEAKYKFDHRGWQPWESSNKCHHALD